MSAAMISDRNQYYQHWVNDIYEPQIPYTFNIPIGPERFFEIPQGVDGAFPLPRRSRAARETLADW